MSSLRMRRSQPARLGFIEPCLPSESPRPPVGDAWLHEIKHDGYRLMARRDGAGVRLLTRNGHDWTPRFPLIAEAVNALKVRSCLIDGEAVACGDDGVASFKLLRGQRHPVIMYAFDLIELDGVDLRKQPIEERKSALAKILRKAKPGVQMCEHLDFDDGALVFEHACRLGLEGIVSKRKGSRYHSGRTREWLKTKNPASPAVRRESEEDWSKPRRYQSGKILNGISGARKGIGQK